MSLLRWNVKGAALDGNEYDANLDAIARSSIPVLTIASGIITIPSSANRPAPGMYYILPESGTVDDLTQINGALGWEEWIGLRTATSGHIITVIHNGTNLCLSPSTFVMDSTKDILELRSRAVNVWVEVNRKSIPQ